MMASAFPTGKREARRGRGLTPHQTAQPASAGDGLGQDTHLPHDGQLHGAPSVSSPVHQARQEVSNESACNCGQEVGEVGDQAGDSPAHPLPKSGSPAFIHLLACSLTRYGGWYLFSTWDVFLPVNGVSGRALLSLYLLCPGICGGSFVWGVWRESRGQAQISLTFPYQELTGPFSLTPNHSTEGAPLCSSAASE